MLLFSLDFHPVFFSYVEVDVFNVCIREYKGVQSVVNKDQSILIEDKFAKQVDVCEKAT
jgi:hypothetical protein